MNTTVRRRLAFTLIEALVAIALTATAGSVLLLAVTSSQQTTDDALKRRIATGLAEQLMDEILGQRYCENRFEGYEVTFGPTPMEAAGPGRRHFNDIDDYHGLRTHPPQDLYGMPIGSDNGEGGLRPSAFRAPPGLLDRLRQEVGVYYVSEVQVGRQLAGGATGPYRTVEVCITEQLPNSNQRRWLARLVRTVGYVPPLE